MPRRLDLTRPGPDDVQRLIDDVAPSAAVTPLDGFMNRNIQLRGGAGQSGDQVLRIYQRYISRARLMAIQQVRRHVAHAGLRAAVAVEWHGSSVLRCGLSYAELEPFLPHRRPEPSWESYSWLFGAMADLHRALADLALPVPRPQLSFSATPSTLQRAAARTRAAVQDDVEALSIVDRLDHQLVQLARGWVSSADLVTQIIHGDINPENIGRISDGAPVYLDFGFTARRPRIYDLAFTFIHAVLQNDKGPLAPRDVSWHRVLELIDQYQRTAGPLSTPERRALPLYAAAVRLLFAATSYFSPEPGNSLRQQRPSLDLASWLLDNPEALGG